jgi:hypothetical protein
MTAAHGVGTPKGLPLLRPGQSGLHGEPPELVVVVEAAALYMGDEDGSLNFVPDYA